MTQREKPEISYTTHLPGEHTRVGPREIQKQRVIEDCLGVIQEEISPLTNRAKQRVMLNVRKLLLSKF